MMVAHEVASPWLGNPRKVWIHPSLSGRAAECVVFLDGELYRDRVQVPQIMDGLQASGRLPPVDCVYVSAVDAAARHVELTCNSAFASFVADDLCRWMTQTLGPQRYFLCGLSLSGLAAVFTALQHPTVFSGVVSQSPSAWWNDEWLTAELTPASRPGKFWMSVGNRELDEGVSHPPSGFLQQTSQLSSVRRLAERLAHAGHRVQPAEFDGGHDPTCWAQELPQALTWLMGDDARPVNRVGMDVD